MRSETDEAMDDMKEADQQIEKIQKELEKTINKANQLENQSEQIEKVVEAISDIEEQTNLLALNASIKVARTGEQKRRFAVVAEKTQDETENIRETIEKTPPNS